MVTASPKTLSASAFKARCLALMDEGERTSEPVIITKHGRPVAQLTLARPVRVGFPVFGLYRGQLTELDAASHDQPVIDPSAWTADEATLT